jgi:multidrug efflux pump subunit AcrA (membrane-fusion protein)
MITANRRNQYEGRKVSENVPQRRMAALISLFIRAILPLLLLVTGSWLAWKIFQDSSPPRRRERRLSKPQVQAQALQKANYQITLRSRGLVLPRTRTVLRAELAGRVTKLAPQFFDGKSFDQGDVLIEFDKRETSLALSRAEAELAGAKARLAALEVELKETAPQIELAAAELVVQSRRLERTRMLAEKDLTPIDSQEGFEIALVSAKTRLQTLKSRANLLEAQQQSLQSEIELAQLNTEAARVNLAKTEVRAPYKGQFMSRSVDLGQYITLGTELAQVFSNEIFEVRLPLTAQEAAQLDFKADDSTNPVAPVVLESSTNPGLSWSASIARIEPGVDLNTRQVFVVASISGAELEKGPLLRPGTFVRASLPGQVLRDVYVVPRGLIRGEDELLVISKSTLRRATVDLIWSDTESAVLRNGINDDDHLCLTALVFGGSSIEVEVMGAKGHSAPKKVESSGGATSPSGSQDEDRRRSGAGSAKAQRPGSAAGGAQ